MHELVPVLKTRMNDRREGRDLEDDPERQTRRESEEQHATRNAHRMDSFKMVRHAAALHVALDLLLREAPNHRSSVRLTRTISSNSHALGQ